MADFTDISELTDDSTLNDSESSQENDTEPKKRPINYAFTDEDRQKAVEVRQAKDAQRIQEIIQAREISKFEHMLKMEQLRTQAIEMRMQRQEMREMMNKPADNPQEDSMLNEVIGLAKAWVEMQKMQQQPRTVSQSSPTVALSPQTQPHLETVAPVVEELSDEEVEMYVSKIPAGIILRAKADTDENIKAQIISYRPNLSNTSIAKLIARIRK